MDQTMLVRDSIVDQLTQMIGQDILTGKYPPGSNLPPERMLAGSYGVTRTSLKHSLVRLEEAGLIETKHGVGSKVTDFLATGGASLLPLLMRFGGFELIDSVLEARALLGSVIVEKAAILATEEEKGELRTLLIQLQEAKSSKEAQLIEAECHKVIARASKNAVFILLVNTLLNAYLPIGDLLLGPFRDPVSLAEDLRGVIDAICANNSELSRKMALKYFETTGKFMKGDKKWEE